MADIVNKALGSSVLSARIEVTARIGAVAGIVEWGVQQVRVVLRAFAPVAARRLADPSTVGPCPESFSGSVTLLAASGSYCVYRQLPRQDFHL
jgi:hypothetical protein